MDRGERRTELLGLLERDYRSARDLMSSANGSIDRTRTFGFALVAALIGFTASNHTLWLGLLATLACALLAYLDGIQSSRYNEASTHALRVERIQQLLYRDTFTGTFNARDQQSLNVRTAAFRPGVLTGQGRFKFTPRELRYSLPKPILYLYLLLALAGVGIGIYESTTGSTQTVNARILRSSAQPPHGAPDLGMVLRESLGGPERTQLAKLANDMRHSKRPGAHALGAAIAAVLGGTPGAAATLISSLAQRGGAVEQQAAEIISKALADAALAGAGGASQTTVNNNQSHFSLNAPSFVLNAAPPNTRTKQKHPEAGEPDRSGEGNGGTPGPSKNDETTSTSSRRLPFTP